MRYGLDTKQPDIAVRAALNLSSVYKTHERFSGGSPNTSGSESTNSPDRRWPSKDAAIYSCGDKLQPGQELGAAQPLFYAGIDSALSQGEIQTAASGWNQLGYMRLQGNHLAKAEVALTEAFRLRRLAGNRNLTSSYVYLCMLRIAQGDALSALNLIESAIQLATRTDAAVPAYVLYYWRAKAKTAMGDVRAALDDFEKSVDLATLWRQEVLPTDGFRISAEVGLDIVYDDYVETGMRAWELSKDPALARRMFEVSEEHRSASFREMDRKGKPLPAEYWEALSQYRSVLISSFASPTDAAVERARLQLARVESGLGLKADGDSNLQVSSIQRRLTDQESLISFHTGNEKSYVWAITRNGFVSQIVPGRRRLNPLIAQFRQSIEKSAQVSNAGADLYSLLFGNLGSQIQSKPDWLLSLDHGLFDVPFAALGPAKAPLMLSHSLRTIPGAALLSTIGFVSQKGGFVGAGDAIYNSADPRWKGKRNAETSQFARLINTRREVTSVSQAWASDQPPTLLFGESFNRDALDQAFRAEPAIVHIAAHVVQGQSDASNVMIGVGMANNGKLDFLTSADIAAHPARLGLVSINGCASGSGATLPGAGLIGLTRAWLLAGATAVAATYWPVEDDRGELFAGMYRELTRSGATITPSNAARALQKAQIAAFQSGGPRSAPNIWSAVFLAAKR